MAETYVLAIGRYSSVVLTQAQESRCWSTDLCSPVFSCLPLALLQLMHLLPIQCEASISHNYLFLDFLCYFHFSFSLFIFL